MQAISILLKNCCGYFLYLGRKNLEITNLFPTTNFDNYYNRENEYSYHCYYYLQLVTLLSSSRFLELFPCFDATPFLNLLYFVACRSCTEKGQFRMGYKSYVLFKQTWLPFQQTFQQLGYLI